MRKRRKKRDRENPAKTDHAILHLHRVGVFATLTNSYALTAIGASENFYRYVAYADTGQNKSRRPEGRRGQGVDMRPRKLEKTPATRQTLMVHAHTHTRLILPIRVVFSRPNYKMSFPSAGQQLQELVSSGG